MHTKSSKLEKMMKGFSKEFDNPEHYIIDITNRIWIEGGVGLINDWYSENCVVRTPYGAKKGIEPVIRSTLSSMQEFHEELILHEDIIIGEKSAGFYSSHRPRMLGKHMGNGSYGSPTGREINSLGIADCLCRGNKIVEEWLVRDQAGIAVSLGLDIQEIVNQRVASAQAKDIELDPKNLLESWVDSEGFTLVGDADIGKEVVDGWKLIWDENRADEIPNLYDQAAVVEAPIGRLYRGHKQIGEYFFELMSPFPGRRFQAHHVIVRRGPECPPTVAIRWSISTAHQGSGRFGTPSDAPVAILGISHVELNRSKIIREWTAVDFVSIGAQIELYRQMNNE